VRALKALREQHAKRRSRQGTARIEVQEADKSGLMVIEAKAASFGYDLARPVIRNVNTLICRGDKLALIGPNGCGKTTLLKLLLGQLLPQSGVIRQGTNLQIAYFDQVKASLDDEKTVQQNVSEYDVIRINGQERHIIGYLQDFLFSPERARSQVKYLSGGERARLLLARLFTQPANLLVLDEPTNDLDLETLELLESLLVDFGGTVLVVSHDRAFINNVATSTLFIDSSGEVREFDGGYDDFLRQRPDPALKESDKEKPARPEPASSVIATPQPARKKLTNKEQRELEALPGLIEKLENEIARVEAAMADPAFYKQDKSAIASQSNQLDRLRNDLSHAYERWEALEGA
jgi:ATP-binding cassette subfamily F protein uup